MLALITLALAQQAPAEAPAAPPPAALAAPTPDPAQVREAEPSAALTPTVLTPTVLTPRAAPSEGHTVPFRLALVPGVGIGASPGTSVEGLSLGILAHGKDHEGVDAQLAGSWLTGRMEGVQTALAYTVADEVHGVQATLGVAWATGDVSVGQFSNGINVAEGHVDGVQATLGINIARQDLRGLQASSGLNVAGGDVEGVQATLGLNLAGQMEGVQVGSVNVAEDLEGAQIGWLNVGKEVKGLQLGLVNIAETSDVSIAPINLIGDGLHRVDVWASESAVASVAAKIGSKHVYTLGGVGWVGLDQPWWTFGGGFGAHLQKQRVWLEIDASAWAIAKGAQIVPGIHNKLRAQVGVEVAKAFQPFAGVSLNGWYGIGNVWPTSAELPTHIAPDRRVVYWPGLHAGVSF